MDVTGHRPSFSYLLESPGVTPDRVSRLLSSTLIYSSVPRSKVLFRTFNTTPGTPWRLPSPFPLKRKYFSRVVISTPPAILTIPFSTTTNPTFLLVLNSRLVDYLLRRTVRPEFVPTRTPHPSPVSLECVVSRQNGVWRNLVRRSRF